MRTAKLFPRISKPDGCEKGEDEKSGGIEDIQWLREIEMLLVAVGYRGASMLVLLCGGPDT